MRKRILSIQGGGVNGIFAARMLSEVERNLREDGKYPHAGAYFDIIAGTSTGGIIALALALHIPASEIVDLYLSKSATIFPRGRKTLVSKLLRQALKSPWYSSHPLVDELKKTFGEKPLGESKTRVMIPVFDSRKKAVRVLKTAHHKIFKNDYKLCVWDIAAATAAAPIYFKEHKMRDDRAFIDGGVWANNPAGIAVAEGVQYCGWNREEIDLLSIGGVTDVSLSKYWKNSFRIPGLIIDAQNKGAIALAKTLIGDVNGSEKKSCGFYDYSHLAPDGEFALDRAEAVKALSGIALDQYRSKQQELSNVFFGERAEEFVPCYTLGEDTMKAQ